MHTCADASLGSRVDDIVAAAGGAPALLVFITTAFPLQTFTPPFIIALPLQNFTHPFITAFPLQTFTPPFTTTFPLQNRNAPA